MSSVKMIFFILVFLLGGLWETEAVSVTGELGKKVTIECSHVNAFSNVKYFCKGACAYEDVLISSKTNGKDSNLKYSIKDGGNTFSVTISSLTEDDSGTYWCGVERIGVDTYNKVVITVIQGNTKDSLQSNSKASFSKKLVYIGAGLGVVLLALAIVLLIFFRHRNRDIHAASGKDHDTVYATHSCQKQDGHHITTSPSTANEDQETDSISSSPTVQHRDTSGDHTENIYSNVTVSSESQTQPDDLFYSTVNFNTHTDGSTVTPHTAALTYSSIKHGATDESAAYYKV
ncbi:CMRF35-like molecule 1 [Sebastes umbrosus]|uniref:CMRF35-like molecule 1 n=1 Tax=Sebastes umbrosus TaxID=72105 RepID=UPI00189E4347|nr:CMRF35-like molecule 1 [Sebastes umbrosus]